MKHTVIGLFALLVATVCCLVATHAQAPPPYPNSGYGVLPANVWSFGSATNAALNPLNQVGAAADGSGGTSGCTNTDLHATYVFNVLENYQQRITFFPAACTNLVARITAVPPASKGMLFQYSPTQGQSYPISSASVPYDLPTNMALFQPALNEFSVYDYPRTAGLVNSSLATIVFQLVDSSVGATLPTFVQSSLPGNPIGSQVQFWVLWQNQPPVTRDVTSTMTTQDAGYDNQVLSLDVTDPDLQGTYVIDQILTATILTLPTNGARLYQYDASNAPTYRGVEITAPMTQVEDDIGFFRVVFVVAPGGTGRPYSTFTYGADDTFVDNIDNGLVTMNVLVEDTPVALNGRIAVKMNSQVMFTLNATSLPETYELNRATITTMPTRGSIFQVLPDLSIGQRIQVVPTAVADSKRRLYFKPDTYSYGQDYAWFNFTVNNGVKTSANQGQMIADVALIHLAPFAQPIFAQSPSGADVSIRFIGTTLEAGNPTLTAVITTLPTIGKLKQTDGTLITNASLPCNVTDRVYLTVIYTPGEGDSLTSARRYTESFLFQIDDNMGDPNSRSAPAVAKVQVGSTIRPPLVFSQTYYTRQNETIIIQLNGTAQDTGDSWTAYISTLPQYGALYQMNNAQRGPLISGTAATPVADPNFYLYFVPNRFSPRVVNFTFYGLNADVQSATTAVATIIVEPVGFAPTVPGTGSVMTPASTPVVYQCTFDAGPSPPPTVRVYIVTAPAAGSFYQWNSTTQTRGALITPAMIAAGIAAGYPGALVTDRSYNVLFDPPPYVHGPATQNFAYAQFVYIARDGALQSPAPSTVTISVSQVNFPPEVSDATITTAQETPVTIYLRNYVFNPSAADGNTYTCIISSMPTLGSLYQVDANGKMAAQPIPVPNVIVTDAQTRVIYKPRLGTGQWGVGYDSFKFFAEDQDHFVRSVRYAQLTIDVTFVNKLPVTPSFSARMWENQAKIIQLPAYDPEGAPVTTYITAANLPYGQLFQFVPSGGGLPRNANNDSILAAYAELSVGGLENDPEFGLNWAYGNYTGEKGGGYDHSQYVGVPITSYPIRVTDPGNRVVFLPTVYTHGNAAYDYLYGLAAYPSSGTFTYIANDGMDNTTAAAAGTVSVKVQTVVYAPLAYTREFDMDEDGFLVITLPIYAFDPDESPACKILSIPTIGALYQYNGLNSLNPKAEQILSPATQVQDINPDGTPGSGRTVVYQPPLLHYGKRFANFSFGASNQKNSAPGMVYINVNKINHRPTTNSFSVVLSGHNSTVPVKFNITDVDYNAVHLNITSFPKRGQLWAQSVKVEDTSTSGFNTYSPVPGTMLAAPTTTTSKSSFFYPDPPADGQYRSIYQEFSILFDDFNMGGAAVPAGCVVEGSTVPCGYSNFTYRVIDEAGAYSDGFVSIVIQCGPSYVINTWQTIGAACVQCPIGAICASEGQFTPLAEPGYWRGITSTGLMFVGCLPPEACAGSNSSAAVGDLDSQCAKGYHGRMCAACSERYYKLNDSCMPCTDTGVFWIILIGVPIVVLLMAFVLHISRRSVDLTFFVIVLTYCQILAVYAQYHLTWPTSVLTALTVFSITHLNLDIFAVSCYYNTGSYSDKWKAKMAVIPGLALGVVLLIGLLMAVRATCGRCLITSEMRARAKARKENPQMAQAGDLEQIRAQQLATMAAANAAAFMKGMKSSGPANNMRSAIDRLEKEADLAAIDPRAYASNDPSMGFDETTSRSTWNNYYTALGMRAFTLLMFIAYLPICVKVFQLFNCSAFPDGTYTFDADWSLTCYSPWWYQLQPFGIVAVIVYGIGIPCWFAYGLRRTAPKFHWHVWWGPIRYPKVDTAGTPQAAAARLKASAAASAAEQDQVGPRPKKPLPPPPPSNPPAIPAPADDGATSSEMRPRLLHAKTVEALGQVHRGATEHDLSSRKARREQDEGSIQARKESAWARSSNLALTSASSSVLTEEGKIARFMFTLVIDPFRDDLFFWMFVILLRSFLLAMVSIFFADEPVYQATLALLVLFVYTLAAAYFQPYVNPQMNRLEFLTMSCACLVLFTGFLFVGESDKHSVIFQVLAAISCTIICVSFLFIGKVVFAKLEEVFHCWNCRRVPIVQAPSAAAIEELARTMRAEIQAGHHAGSLGLRQAATQSAKPQHFRAEAGRARDKTPREDSRSKSGSGVGGNGSSDQRDRIVPHPRDSAAASSSVAPSAASQEHQVLPSPASHRGTAPLLTSQPSSDASTLASPSAAAVASSSSSTTARTHFKIISPGSASARPNASDDNQDEIEMQQM